MEGASSSEPSGTNHKITQIHVPECCNLEKIGFRKRRDTYLPAERLLVYQRRVQWCLTVVVCRLLLGSERFWSGRTVAEHGTAL